MDTPVPETPAPRRDLFFILAGVALFFWRPLTAWTFYFRDIHLHLYPKKAYFLASLRAGTFPLWDPMTNGGEPFVVSFQSFYPPNYLLVPFSPTAAVNIWIVGHFMACAGGAWWLARLVGLSRAGCVLAAAAYVFSGYSLSAANVWVHLVALAWMPLSLALFHLGLVRGSRLALAGAALSTAMPILGGGVEGFAMLAVLLLIWAAGQSTSGRGKAAAVAVALVVILSATGLALVQVVPTLEAIRESSRGEGLSYEKFTQWSVNPRRLPELVIPSFFGRTDTMDDAMYWGRRFEYLFPYFLSIYLGAAVLLLAAMGGASPPVAHLPNRALLAAAVGGLLLSLGASLPFFRLLYDLLPPVRSFRFPVKLILVSILPIAILAGHGLDVLRANRRRAALAAVTMALVFLAVGAAAVLLGASEAFRARTAAVFYGDAAAARSIGSLARSLWHAAAVASAAAGCLVGMIRGIRAAAPALVCVVLFDLASAGARVNLYAPRSIYSAPVLAGRVRAMVGDSRFAALTPLRDTYRLRAPSDDLMWVARWRIETLRMYLGQLFGIRVTLHDDFLNMAPRPIVVLRRAFERLPWGGRVPLLEVAGVRAFVTRERVAAGGAHLAGEVPSADRNPLYLYSVPDAARARFVSRVRYLPSPEAVLERMTSNFAADELLLTGTGEARPGCGSAPIRLLSDRPDRTRYEIDAPCDGFAFFSENHFPGWRARLDGSPVELLRADYAFSAVAVPRGKHVVEREYGPRSVAVGLAGTFVAALLLIPMSALAAALARGAPQGPATGSRSSTAASRLGGPLDSG